MVTQVEEPLQRVLYAYPQEAVPSGTALLWESSFCRSMVSGVGPRVATVTAATPVYRDLRTGLTERVAAYIGVPLVTRSGELYGTLCGVSARAQPRSLIRFLPQVEMTARLLSSLLPRQDEHQPATGSSLGPALDRPVEDSVVRVSSEAPTAG
jgi:GAF domain-containing protein